MAELLHQPKGKHKMNSIILFAGLGALVGFGVSKTELGTKIAEKDLTADKNHANNKKDGDRTPKTESTE